LKKILFFSILPALLVAGSIKYGFSKLDTSSSYKVTSKDGILSAKLNFPAKYKTFFISYCSLYKGFEYKLLVSKLYNSSIKTGSDYDWRYDKVTVFSYSKDKLNSLVDYGFQISKDYNKKIKLLLGYNYKETSHTWIDTYQTTTKTNNTIFIKDKTLHFQEKFYTFFIGSDFRTKLFDKVSCVLSPKLLLSYIDTKDEHILRDFFVTQNFRSIGYEIDVSLLYNISKNNKINIFYRDKKLTKSHIKMKYHDRDDYVFQTLPSSYRYKENSLSLSIIHTF